MGCGWETVGGVGGCVVNGGLLFGDFFNVDERGFGVVGASVDFEEHGYALG